MAIGISTAAQNAGVNAIAGLVDADVGAGTITIRTGAGPATANDAPTGTLLATLTLNDPAFSTGVAGVATLDVTPAVTTTGVAAGTAGYFRLHDNSGDVVLQGSVTVTAGGGDLELNTTSIAIGTTVEITSGTLTMPAA
jgi:hypothetical protein